MIKHHSIPVIRTAHYATLGEVGPHIRYFCIACHGYGQLASRFIRKFEAVEREDTFILAPEGLSRFYWGGLTGDVVASWMTKGNRLDEIADYSKYLSTLYELYTSQLHPDVKIMLLGFSQGCATQVRWLMREKPHFHQLTLWAGAIPEDIDYSPERDYLADKDILFVYGTKDQFLTPERIAMHNELIKEKGLTVRQRTFEGEHTIDRDMLATVFQEFRKP